MHMYFTKRLQISTNQNNLCINGEMFLIFCAENSYNFPESNQQQYQIVIFTVLIKYTNWAKIKLFYYDRIRISLNRTRGLLASSTNSGHSRLILFDRVSEVEWQVNERKTQDNKGKYLLQIIRFVFNDSFIKYVHMLPFFYYTQSQIVIFKGKIKPYHNVLEIWHVNTIYRKSFANVQKWLDFSKMFKENPVEIKYKQNN